MRRTLNICIAAVVTCVVVMVTIAASGPGTGPFLVPGSGGGGGGGAGTGIQTNGGTGNANGFTNVTLWTPGNTQGAIVITNDTVNSVNNSGAGVDLEFSGVSTTNQAALVWLGLGGVYGDIFFNTTHDGSPASPIKSELEIEGANRIAIIPDFFQTGDDNGIQIGGVSNPDYLYFQIVSNMGPNLVAPSMADLHLAEWESNSTAVYSSRGGMINDWPSAKYESHLYIFADDGRTFSSPGTSWGGLPDKNAVVKTIDARVGLTSQNTNYFSVKLLAGLGGSPGITNQLNVDTNGVDAGGLLSVSNGITDQNAGSDAWIGPNTFEAGTAGSPTFITLGGNIEVAGGGSQALFEVGDSAVGTTHDYIRAGANGWGGTALGLNGTGVSIGSNNVAFSGFQLVVAGNGQTIIPTNAAPVVTNTGSVGVGAGLYALTNQAKFGFVTNFALTGSSYTNAGQFITNFTGARVLLHANAICSISGAGNSAKYLYQPNKNGVNYNTNVIYGIVLNQTASQSEIGLDICDQLGPGDYCFFQAVVSAGQASSFVNITNLYMEMQ